MQLSDLFFNWPTSPKPPIESFSISGIVKKPVYHGDNPDPAYFSEAFETVAWEIQMALAGFNKNDVWVWTEENILHIRGDNTHRQRQNRKNTLGIVDKFTSRFHHEFACSLVLDINEAIVSFKDGLLRVNIPISKKTENRQYLFGSE